MAGQPIKRALVAQLEKRAQRLSEEREEAVSALDVVYEYIASRSGKMADLALDLGKAAGLQLSERNAGAVLTMWVNGQDGGREMLERARQDAAHVLVDEAIDLVDDVDEDKQAIAKAKLQAEQRNWLASRWNRRAYGQQDTAVNVNLNMGDLYLDALRVRKLEEQQAIPLVDYETVPQLPAGSADAANEE